ncbi:MAG: hypothetical protein R2795_05335 [Saprospiraceae bacterium]
MDGQYATSQGAFRLEVSCGYLYCGDAVAFSVANPIKVRTSMDKTMYRSILVAIPSMWRIMATEIVHTFTTTQSGP